MDNGDRDDAKSQIPSHYIAIYRHLGGIGLCTDQRITVIGGEQPINTRGKGRWVIEFKAAQRSPRKSRLKTLPASRQAFDIQYRLNTQAARPHGFYRSTRTAGAGRQYNRASRTGTPLKRMHRPQKLNDERGMLIFGFEKKGNIVNILFICMYA